MRVVFVGAGNLATRLSLEMRKSGMSIGQVYSHTSEHAKILADELGCGWTVIPEEIVEDADLYVFSLKDAVLQDVIARVKPNNGLWVHTAGSMPISVFEGLTARYGVVYPLQTFSKSREVDFKKIPFFPCILSYKTTNNRYSYCSDTEFSSDAIRNTDFPSYAI